MGLYELDRQDKKQYKGFVLIVNDYKNTVVNKVIREVSIHPVSVSQDVYLMYYRRMTERLNKFETLKEAKGLIDSCYRACSMTSKVR